MPADLVYYITRYGYLAIFILIFLQEIGLPNPVPNELVLIFCGFLIRSGVFKFYDVIVVALLADFSGTNILYFVFRMFGYQILNKQKAWILISRKRIDSLTLQMSGGGLFIIFICRLTPFIRGYTSVIAGLLQVRVNQFLIIAFISALTWASTYIFIGWLLAPYWGKNETITHFLRIMLIVMMALVALFFLAKFIFKGMIVRKRLT